MAILAKIERIGDHGIVQNVADFGIPAPANIGTRYYIDISGYHPQPVAPEAGLIWSYDFKFDRFHTGRRSITARELWLIKLTETERSKVWALCNGESVPGITITLENRYRLASYRDISLTGEPIQLDGDETVTVFTALETVGLLAVGRKETILEITL